MVLDKYELAWAAGFFDGEGSAVVHKDLRRKNPYYNVRLSIGQSGVGAEKLLRRFQIAVGGFGIVSGPFVQNERWKPKWYWVCNGIAHCQVVYALFWQFLGDVKQDQIYRSVQEALEKRSMIVPLRDRKWSLPRLSVPGTTPGQTNPYTEGGHKKSDGAVRAAVGGRDAAFKGEASGEGTGSSSGSARADGNGDAGGSARAVRGPSRG